MMRYCCLSLTVLLLQLLLSSLVVVLPSNAWIPLQVLPVARWRQRQLPPPQQQAHVTPLPQNPVMITTNRNSMSLFTFSDDSIDMGYDMEEPPPQSNDNDDEEVALTDEELLDRAGGAEWDDKIPRYNTIHLTGRIGQDPQPKYFDDGKVVVNLSLASRRKYHSLERKVKNMNYNDDETDWYGLEIWGQQAEFVSKFVEKGARVSVIGSLQVDTWTDTETGELRNKVKVVVRELDILETKAEANLRRGGGQQQQQSNSNNYNNNNNNNYKRGPSFYTNDDDDDDDDGGYGGGGGRNPAGTGGFFDM